MACVPEIIQIPNEVPNKRKLNAHEANKKRLKVLCIHGFRQNDEVFKQKLGAVRKILKKHVEFVFVTAPHEVPPSVNPDEVSNGEQNLEHRGWWFTRDDMTFNSKEYSDKCVGFQRSWNDINELSIADGPFDGLLGFSQGAAFVALLCGMQEKNWIDFKFQFAILVAGFKSRSLPHSTYYKDKLTIPTLHVFGEMDQVIPKEMSEELASCFENATILLHPGGHFVPAAAAQKAVYLDFIEKMLKKKEEEEEEEEEYESDVSEEA